MKKLFLALGLLAAVVARGQTDWVEEKTEPAPAPAKAEAIQLVDFSADLDQVTADLKKKFDAHQIAETNLNENLKAINALIVKHQKDGNREQVARLYLLDAHIYADALTNTARARAIWIHVAKEFPGTLAAQGAALQLTRLNAIESAAPDPSIPEGLEVGQRFPGFNTQDIAGNPLSLAANRGQVTMIDFWATWCGPCKAEMPNVIATYRKYHALGFDIIGVSLDSKRDAVIQYTQATGMTWRQYFDGKGWNNALAKQYGVNSIPMAYLLDRHGVIIGKSLRGRALGAAVEKALKNN